MLTLVLGGVRSGKSNYAHDQAEAYSGPVVYAVTAEATDDEMARRIAKHREERPSEWRTIELEDSEAQLAGSCPHGTLLVFDCLSVYVGRVVAQVELAEDLVSAEEEGAAWRSIEETLGLLCAMEGDVMVVANEVGMGVVPATPMGRLFRDLMGRANQWLAARAEAVIFIVAGLPVAIKGPGKGV